MQLTSTQSSFRGRAVGGTSGRGAFTLLELIVVITIIGILGSLVVYNLSGVTPRARRMKVESDCKRLVQAAEAMQAESGRYPEAIDELINAEDENGQRYSVSLDEYPRDPWGNEYIYELIDGRPTVTCYGSDNQQGGEGEAADYTFPEESETSF